MPVLGSSSYNTAEDVLNRVRNMMDDSEIEGGDVITDDSVFAFDLLNSGFERVQKEIMAFGGDSFTKEAWLIGLPSMPSIDPEARLIVDDTGCNIIYPNGVGNVFAQSPQLPTDLEIPLDCWERQNGTANFTGGPMGKPPNGLLNIAQQNYLVDWEWQNDGLRFRGALQSIDVKVKYQKLLPKLVASTDPVPIRGVVNAAAYHTCVVIAGSRAGQILPEFKAQAQREIVLFAQISSRRHQRMQTRRKPYSGRGGRQQAPYL